MRRALLTLLCVLSVGGMCRADDGHGEEDEGDISGPQGPAGPQGVAGQNGKNGANGTSGINGRNGIDASAQYRGVDVVGGVAIRLYDAKYFQLQAFDDYVFRTDQNQDIFSTGHNQAMGGRIVFKLGKSWEEELIEKQAAQLAALEAELSRLQQ